MGLPFLQQANVLSIRFDNGHSQPTPRQRSQPGSSGKKRAPGFTDVISADSFDIEEDMGQLPRFFKPPRSAILTKFGLVGKRDHSGANSPNPTERAVSLLREDKET
jgi:hypothetical protein